MAISKTMTIQQPPQFMSKGTILGGKYRIIEPIGKGGMGVVYKAEDIQLERTVALKFLPAELTEDSEARERFVREAKAAAALSHPHICTVYEIGEEENQYFIAMECIEGQSLKQKIHKGPLDQAEALDIAIQVAEGLEEAHKKGIVHRDIKPSNIMVTDKGTAKVMDFGLAKVFGASLITKEAKTMGTVAYMSPEQAQGQSIDHRTDIWSLGVVLYEMITGQLPFKGEYEQSVMYAIVNKEAEPLTKVIPHISKALENVVLTALSKNPANRYQSMAEFLEDLRAIAEGLKPLRAKARPVKGKILGVRKIYFYATFIVPLVLFGAAALFLSRGREKPPSAPSTTSIAVLPFTDLSPAKDQEVLCQGIAETLLNSLSNIGTLQVRAKYSSFLFTSQDNPQEVGRKLNAEWLLTGSLQMVGNLLRVTVQLIKAADGVPLWSDQYTDQIEEIFNIQDKITSAAVTKLDLVLSNEERRNLAKRYSNNKEAYELYLKGSYINRQWVPDAVTKAIFFYLEAIKKEPDFVLPYISLARCYSQLYNFVLGSREESYNKSKEMLDKAFALDSKIGVAYSVLAELNYDFENDLASAEQNWQRALRLSPKSPFVLEGRYVFLSQRMRLKEAESDISLLIEIDPLNPQNYCYLGSIYYSSTRYDDAVIAFQKALELDPNHINSLWSLVFTYLVQGRNDEAIKVADHLGNVFPVGLPRIKAYIEAAAGNGEEAEKYKVEAKPFFGHPGWGSLYYAVLGDRKKTLENLTRLYNEDKASVWSTFSDPFFDKYRTDPEFVELLKKAEAKS
jgi:serine/threonine protein kinase